MKPKKLTGEWTQIQVIDLLNDGSGLGFGIIGGRSTGVVVKTIVASGPADKDGRLRSGDHLIQIGDIYLMGMSSEQVATVLRQQDQPYVRLVVARSVDLPPGAEPPTIDANHQALSQQSGGDLRNAVTVPTRVITDPNLLEEHVGHLFHTRDPRQPSPCQDANNSQLSVPDPLSHPPPQPLPTSLPEEVVNVDVLAQIEAQLKDVSGSTFRTEGVIPEDAECLEVELVRESVNQGLGITIAGYVHDKEEISGIFVKSITENSVAQQHGGIHPHDQIIEVNGSSLESRSNKEAVDLLRSCGETVRLKLLRYFRTSRKHAYLEMLAAIEDASSCDARRPGPVPAVPAKSPAFVLPAPQESDHPPQPQPPAANDQWPKASAGARSPDADVNCNLNDNDSSQPMNVAQNGVTSPLDINLDLSETALLLPSGSLEEGRPAGAPIPETMSSPPLTSEEAWKKQLKSVWVKVMGADFEILVISFTRSDTSVLGISLEGTVDVEDDGREVRPHHYIRSIAQDGPAKDCGLRVGDELLQVDDAELYGLGHMEVVEILRHQPLEVILVVARQRPSLMFPGTYYMPSEHLPPASHGDPYLGRSSLSFASYAAPDRLIKSKSDISLAALSRHKPPEPPANGQSNGDLDITTGLLNEVARRLRSRSLEPLTGLAVWSDETMTIQLLKGDRGLGFGVVDYQDPLHPAETVIVVRSLVPGGAAAMDGRLIPGDRLMYIGGTDVRNVSLEVAVNTLKTLSKGVVNIVVAKPLPLEYSHDKKANSVQPSPPAPRRQAPSWSGEVKRRRIISSQNQYAPHAFGNLLNAYTTSSLSGSYLSMSSGWSLNSSPSMSPAPPSPGLLRGSWGADVVHLPQSMEQIIRIKKGSLSVGLKLEAVDKGINGCMVKDIHRGGAFGKDGRIKVGDLVLKINNEQLKNATNSQARVVLRRTNLICTDFNVTYVPGSEALKYRDQFLKQLSSSEANMQASGVVNRMSPRSPNLLSGKTSFDTEQDQRERDLEESSLSASALLPVSPSQASTSPLTQPGTGGLQTPGGDTLPTIPSIPPLLNPRAEGTSVDVDTSLESDLNPLEAADLISPDLELATEDDLPPPPPIPTYSRGSSLFGDLPEPPFADSIEPPGTVPVVTRPSEQQNPPSPAPSVPTSPDSDSVFPGARGAGREKLPSPPPPPLFHPTQCPSSSLQDAPGSFHSSTPRFLPGAHSAEPAVLPSPVPSHFREATPPCPLGAVSGTMMDPLLASLEEASEAEEMDMMREEEDSDEETLPLHQQGFVRRITPGGDFYSSPPPPGTGEELPTIVEAEETCSVNNAQLSRSNSSADAGSSRSSPGALVRSQDGSRAVAGGPRSTVPTGPAPVASSESETTPGPESQASGMQDEEMTPSRDVAGQPLLPAGVEGDPSDSKCAPEYDPGESLASTTSYDKLQHAGTQISQSSTSTSTTSAQQSLGDSGVEPSPKDGIPLATFTVKPPAPPSPLLSGCAKYWGEPRTVELMREPGRSLGISIVGGKVEVPPVMSQHTGLAGDPDSGMPAKATKVAGIFIKNVLPQSPAGKSGNLYMGDRIVSVNGVDLKQATHEHAVEVIRNAANPVRFVVQSLHAAEPIVPLHQPPPVPSSREIAPKPPTPPPKPKLTHPLSPPSSSNLPLSGHPSIPSSAENQNLSSPQPPADDSAGLPEERPSSTLVSTEATIESVAPSHPPGLKISAAAAVAAAVSESIESAVAEAAKSLTASIILDQKGHSQRDSVVLSEQSETARSSGSSFVGVQAMADAPTAPSQLQDPTRPSDSCTASIGAHIDMPQPAPSGDPDESSSVQVSIELASASEADLHPPASLSAAPPLPSKPPPIDEEMRENTAAAQGGQEHPQAAPFVTTGDTHHKAAPFVTTGDTHHKAAPPAPSVPHSSPKTQSASDVTRRSGQVRERVDSNSAAALPRQPSDEDEDEYGYTHKKIRLKYADVIEDGELHLVTIKRPLPHADSNDPHPRGSDLGLSLAGNRDLAMLSVFVVGIQPDSAAEACGAIFIGDELLEINGVVLYGRSHLNASAIIKGIRASVFRIALLRRPHAIEDMAVRPLTTVTPPPMTPAPPVPLSVTPPVHAPVGHAGETASGKRPAAKNEAQPPTSNIVVESSEPQTTRKVVVKKGPTGFGITLTEGTTTDRVKGIFVTNLAPHSLTAQENLLKIGDQVIAVNGQSVLNMPSSQLAEMIQSYNEVELSVQMHNIVPPPGVAPAISTPPTAYAAASSPRSSLTTSSTGPPSSQPSKQPPGTASPGTAAGVLPISKTPSPPPPTLTPATPSPKSSADKRSSLTVSDATRKMSASASSTHNFAHAQIEPGVETVIEIDKGGKGLGLSIVGGSDTLLGAVAIHEVYPDGAAAKDGRLQPGDQVLEVNNESLRDIPHERAIQILRQTPPKVRLTVYRDPDFQVSLLNPTSMYNVFEVELFKKPGKGLGLSIVGRKTQPGVFISEVVKGGVADQDGRLMQGDQILTVNGQDLTHAMQEQAATLLKTCMGKVILRVGRLKLTSSTGASKVSMTTPNPVHVPMQTMSVYDKSPSPTPSANASSVSLPLPPPVVAPTQNSLPAATAPNRLPSAPALQNIVENGDATSTSSPPLTTSSPSPPDFTASPQQPQLPPLMVVQAPSSPTSDRSAAATTVVSSSHPQGSSPALLDDSQSLQPQSGSGAVPRTLSNTSAGAGEAPDPPTSPPETAVTTAPASSPPLTEASGTVGDVGSPGLIADLNEDGSETLLVELPKVEDTPLGMGIGIRPRGVLVTSLQENCPAILSLKIGDRLLAVNGNKVVDQASAVQFVRESGPRLFLQVARPRTDVYESSVKNMREIILDKGPEGLGFSVVGGAGSPHGDLPVYVKNVFTKGAASKNGQLKRGDQIVAVNGKSLQGLTHQEAVSALKDVKDRVVLLVIPD